MTAELFLLPFRPALDANGIILPGAELYFYAHGTSTLQSVYTTDSLATPLSNPVTADASGVWPSIYLDASKIYRVVLKDSIGDVIEERDPYMPGIVDDLTAEFQAHAYASASLALATPYSNTTEGLAATADGDYFSVTSGGYLRVYRNDSGVATQLYTYPTSAALASTTAGLGAGLISFESGDVVQDIMESATGKGAALIPFEGGLNTVEDLTSSDSGKGASLVMLESGVSVETAVSGLTGSGPILIVIAGQSNALGSAGSGPNPSSSLVFSWDAIDGDWVAGGQYDTLPWTRTSPDGNGGNNNYALAAAHKISEVTGRQAYVVMDAVSGTSIDAWVASGTSSTRYAALKTKVEAALASPELSGKSTIDLFIWAQGEEDYFDSFATHLANLDTLDSQLRSENWMDDFTPAMIMGMSKLHDRYEVAPANRHFCTKSNGKWRFVSTRGLRTQYDLTATGDFSHFLGDDLYYGGYNLISEMFLNEAMANDEDDVSLFYGRGNGRANPADSTAIATFTNLVSWNSRTDGPSVIDSFDGDGSTTAFTLTGYGTITEVTVGGVVKTSPTDYSVSGQTITFVAAPAYGTDNVVITYAAAINGPAAVGAITWGYRCHADGNYTFAGGYQSIIDNLANYSFLWGRDLYASSTGDFCGGFGYQNTFSAPYGFAAGRGHTVADDYGAAVGLFSEYSTGQSDDVLFQVGNGSSGAPSSALTVRKSGIIEAKDLPTYADNAAATSGGLFNGQIYKTSAGELRIKV